MIKSDQRHLGVMLLLTLILVMLFLYGRSLDLGEKQLITPNLRNIIADDARVNEYVALLRTGLQNNYDHLNTLLQETDVEIRRLETQLGTIPFRNDEKLQSDLVMLRTQFNEKEKLVERFKSHNAILRNSMMYISLTSSQISDAHKKYHTLENNIGRLSILLMKFYRSPDTEIIKAIQYQLKHLIQQEMAPELRLAVQQLKLHVNLTIEFIPEVNRNMSAITAASLREKAEMLMQDYLILFSAQQSSVKIFRWMTYALSVLLLGYLSIILWRLNTSRKKLVELNRELLSEKDRAKATLHSIGDGVMTINRNGIVEFVNPVTERLTDWKMDEAKGVHVRKVLHVLDAATRQPLTDMAFNSLLRGGEDPLHGDTILRSRNGDEHRVEFKASPISSEGSDVQGVVLVIRDITATRHLIDRISHQAQHDALTGLINRREFERRLKNVLIESADENSSHALCYIDLDQFKVINDTCGHMAGDELLRQLSRELALRVRSADTLARLGGDEFGLLLVDCPLPRAMEIAEQLRQVVHEYEFIWEGNRFGVGASIGLVPLGQDDGDAQQALTRADLACYASKDQGRNRIHVYTSEDTALVRRQQEMVWAGNIRHALLEQRLRLYAQPIVQTVASEGNHYPDHYEILVRMLGVNGEEIMPNDFIPAAERFGVMTDVDRWVIEHAFAWHAQRKPSARPVHLCINLSGTSLGDAGLPSFIEERVSYYSLDVQKICFEITETAAVTSLHEAVLLMQRLRSHGIQFSLDDFGSGLSSFNYLKTLPVDYLKIDGSIVRHVVDDPIHRAMVEAINHVGHVMGKKTIAEYVENESIHMELAKLGVDYVQGYIIGKPLLLSTLQ